MNRTIVNTLVAGVIAAAALAAPAQAGHRSHGHGHGHGHVVKFHNFHAHKFHAYRPVYVHYEPVCIKSKWVYSYGHKKVVCVLWK